MSSSIIIQSGRQFRLPSFAENTPVTLVLTIPPYYPINTEKNQALYKAYRELAAAQQDVVFGGRLGSYKYLDMDDAVKAALVCYDQEIKPRLAKR